MADVIQFDLNIFYPNTKLIVERINENFNIINSVTIEQETRVTKVVDDKGIDPEPLLPMLAPNAPSNLVGNLSDDGETALMGLTFQDNSDNESGFELWEYYSLIGWGSKESIIANGEFVQTEIQRIPEYEIGDYLLSTTDPSFAWKVRAWNSIGYSGFSNVAQYSPLPQPSISSNSLTVYPTNISYEISSYNSTLPQYQEIWINYGPNSLEGFLETPWVLLDKKYTLDGELVSDMTLPEPDISDNEMLNQYLFVKVRAYSAVLRSAFSSIQNKILPPIAPTNPSVTLNDFYGSMGGDYITEIRWENNSGDDTEIEIWGKWGAGDWELLDTSGGTWFGWEQDSGSRPIGFNHNIGMHPTGARHYKVRAINDSGESEFSEEVSVDTFEPVAPSNLSATLTWLTGTHDYTIVLNWTNNDSYENIEIERKIDSGEFSLLTTLTGSPNTYSDHIGIPSVTHTYYYRIRGEK